MLLHRAAEPLKHVPANVKVLALCLETFFQTIAKHSAMIRCPRSPSKTVDDFIEFDCRDSQHARWCCLNLTPLLGHRDDVLNDTAD
jgi:hypothetical protein